MRTKSLCLAAAAVLGGMLTAQAQNVYSLNVVGYVNRTVANGFTLLANPLDDGNGNQASNLVPASLPAFSKVYKWNGASFDFTSKKSTGAWGPMEIPPGTGFFVENNGGGLLTNTFVGEVAGALPGSLTNTLSAGFSLVGSQYPIGGSFTNIGTNTINLPAGLAAFSKVYVWNGTSFDFSSKKSTGAWGPDRTIEVGQGFFIENVGSAVDWIQDASAD